ncbi:MAG: OmpA family protein [Crocinitomicaceae bacterium]|nr:OmpA family protein [Flavobacteriales bacterium]NQZ37048.1 OmpA family protein [Crocinitomicaceae bacterium]
MRFFLTFLISLFILNSYGQNDTLSVYFGFDNCKVPNEQLESLQNLREMIENNDVLLTTFKAYSDTTGTNVYNAKLSEDRLFAVMNALGVDRQNLRVPPKIYGDDIPKHLLSTYSDSLFRRVDILYFKTMNSGILPLHVQLERFMKDTASQGIVELKILFEGGTDKLLVPNNPILNELTEFMKKNLQIKAHVRGHTCCGPDFSLSKRRALRVKTYLQIHGISPDRLTFKGYANTIPIYSPELNATHRKRNRRVDIQFSKEI